MEAERAEMDGAALPLVPTGSVDDVMPLLDRGFERPADRRHVFRGHAPEYLADSSPGKAMVTVNTIATNDHSTLG